MLRYIKRYFVFSAQLHAKVRLCDSVTFRYLSFLLGCEMDINSSMYFVNVVYLIYH